MLSNNLSSNLVLEGSTGSKWRFFYHGTNFVQKFGYARENNYSNNEYIQERHKHRRRINYSNDQIENERLLNIGTEQRNTSIPDICR